MVTSFFVLTHRAPVEPFDREMLFTSSREGENFFSLGLYILYKFGEEEPFYFFPPFCCYPNTWSQRLLGSCRSDTKEPWAVLKVDTHLRE